MIDPDEKQKIISRVKSFMKQLEVDCETIVEYLSTSTPDILQEQADEAIKRISVTCQEFKEILAVEVKKKAKQRAKQKGTRYHAT